MPKVYLIPSLLSEEGEDAIPVYVLAAIKECNVFFVENLRTARRYLKKLDKAIVIDDFEWFETDSETAKDDFKNCLTADKTIGILSEAGCPGVADPGQDLVAIAQKNNVIVRPLVGPNAILLALMASGLNGQRFYFAGYLPIAQQEKATALKQLEAASNKDNSTQIFIETPYRNNQMLQAIIAACKPDTKLCIAIDITSSKESIKTLSVAEWKKLDTVFEKAPAMFLIFAGEMG